MKLKNKLVMLVLMVMMISLSCTPLNLNVAKKTTYDHAMSFFNDAWRSYQKVWVLLPEADKKEWVDKYHTKFKTAGEFLKSWAVDPNDPASQTAWEIIKDELTTILITLAIKNN